MTPPAPRERLAVLDGVPVLSYVRAGDPAHPLVTGTTCPDLTARRWAGVAARTVRAAADELPCSADVIVLAWSMARRSASPRS